MTIQDVISRRNIKTLIHFTRIENLDNILRKGIVPRSGLEDGSYIYNDSLRLDGKFDYSCLSIGFPNDKMFYKLRVDNSDAEWAVIGISPQILINYECLFYPCNAASHTVKSACINHYKGAEAFDNMFQNENSYPQDVQAEVMVKGVIDARYITGFAFNQRKYIDKYSARFPNLKFLLHSANKGFFGKREWTKIGY